MGLADAATVGKKDTNGKTDTTELDTCGASDTRRIPDAPFGLSPPSIQLSPPSIQRALDLSPGQIMDDLAARGLGWQELSPGRWRSGAVTRYTRPNDKGAAVFSPSTNVCDAVATLLCELERRWLKGDAQAGDRWLTMPHLYGCHPSGWRLDVLREHYVGDFAVGEMELLWWDCGEGNADRGMAEAITRVFLRECGFRLVPKK